MRFAGGAAEIAGGEGAAEEEEVLLVAVEHGRSKNLPGSSSFVGEDDRDKGVVGRGDGAVMVFLWRKSLLSPDVRSVVKVRGIFG